jgi:Mn-dependent DtxR family transcriptional regulator
VTPRQSQYLAAISAVSERLGYAPSLAEVAAEVGTKTQSAATAVISLERQGYVARGYATARSLRLTPAGRAALEETAA